MHEMAALCLAAMRPTRETWAKFVDTLRSLHTEGNITDDETAAIVASELAEPLLARLDDDFEPDSNSIEEAIGRVREAYSRDVVATADEAVRRAHAEAALAQRVAAEATTRSNEIRSTIEEHIVRSSRRVSTALFSVVLLLMVLAAVLSLPGISEGVGGVWKWAGRAILVIAAILGLYFRVRGTSLKGLRTATEARIANRMRGRWLPKSELAGAAEVPVLETRRSDVRPAGTPPNGAA